MNPSITPGKFYSGENIQVYPKPIQQPHPPISVATGNPVVLKMAAERGFKLLTVAVCHASRGGQYCFPIREFY